MDIAFYSAANIAGSIAFILGVVLVVIELFKKGLSKLSLVAYICFVAGIILLDINIPLAVLSIAVLSILFLLLWYFYRQETRKYKEPGDDL